MAMLPAPDMGFEWSAPVQELMHQAKKVGLDVQKAEEIIGGKRKKGKLTRAPWIGAKKRLLKNQLASGLALVLSLENPQ